VNPRIRPLRFEGWIIAKASFSRSRKLKVGSPHIDQGTSPDLIVPGGRFVRPGEEKGKEDAVGARVRILGE
jgi:hypothetical protein